MPSRRTALILICGLGLAACGTNPSSPYLFGFGDPIRGAGLSAPRNFGDTSRWAGRPASAAFAVEQLEFLTSSLATDPRYAPVVNPAVLQTLQRARTEMRAYLGIAPNADPQLVIAAMRQVGAALRGGSQAQAEAALSGAAFPAGPRSVLARLAEMPRLPQAAAAAGMVASEMDRLERRN
jgi:hypothetical protein